MLKNLLLTLVAVWIAFLFMANNSFGFPIYPADPEVELFFEMKDDTPTSGPLNINVADPSPLSFDFDVYLHLEDLDFHEGLLGTSYKVLFDSSVFSATSANDGDMDSLPNYPDLRQGEIEWYNYTFDPYMIDDIRIGQFTLAAIPAPAPGTFFLTFQNGWDSITLNNGNSINDNIRAFEGAINFQSTQTVPVPSTLILMFSGIIGMVGIKRRYS